jgi:hypothetical protein
MRSIRTPRIGRPKTTAAALTLAAALGGCAHVHVDAQGVRHVVGLVSMTLPPPDCGAPGAQGLRVRSLGLTLTRGELGDALVLGYQDTAVLALPNDSLVLLQPPARAASSP